MSKTVDELVTRIRYGCQAMRIVTYEETRAIGLIKRAAQEVAKIDKQKMEVVTWDSAAGATSS